MTADTPPQLPGFAVAGYRSFVTPTIVGPLSKVSCLVGPNNSGKSNVLRALRVFMPEMTANNGEALKQLQELDRPRIPGMPDASEEYVFSLAHHSPDGTLYQRYVAHERSRPGPEHERALNALEAALRAPWGRSAGNDLVWVSYTLKPGHSSGYLVEELDRIAGELGDPVVQSLGGISSDLVGTAGGGGHDDLTRVLAGLLPRDIPDVKFIPAERAIVHTTERTDMGEPDPTGRDLGVFLRRLENPDVATHARDYAKFQRINDFLSSVIEQECRLTVSHDARHVKVVIGETILPIENLGSGIAQVSLLATLATIWENSLVCMEEPEVNLHPLMLRSLVRYLRNETSNQYLIATHSAHMLDDPLVNVLTVANTPDKGTEVAAALTPAQRARISQALGYRASDLMQANAIIWVEGPSDRIYIKEWLRRANDKLVEGVHYSVMFYGGRLLSNLSGEDRQEVSEEATDEFVHLPSINRHMAIVIDSDRRTQVAGINSTKQRIKSEFEAAEAIVWITAGREIENYVDRDTFLKAATTIHPTAAPPAGSTDEAFSDRFEGFPDNRRKSAIAQALTAEPGDPWLLDHAERVQELVAFIEAANHEVGRDIAD